MRATNTSIPWGTYLEVLGRKRERERERAHSLEPLDHVRAILELVEIHFGTGILKHMLKLICIEIKERHHFVLLIKTGKNLEVDRPQRWMDKMQRADRIFILRICLRISLLHRRFKGWRRQPAGRAAVCLLESGPCLNTEVPRIKG